MGLQVIALVCLIGAIVLGFVKKTNVGLVCFGLALILGKIGGMGASDIYKGFPFKLFATLLGTIAVFQPLTAEWNSGKDIGSSDWTLWETFIFSTDYHLCG